MSIYYILVNKDKKEWVDSGDIGLGLKSWVYETSITPLLGFLMMDEYGFGDRDDEQYNPNKHIIELDEKEQNDNFSFYGHWKMDTNIHLVSEHNELYDICHGLEDQYKYNGYEGSQEDWNKELKQWVNISIPLAKEWNYRIKYWYEDNPEMNDWVKQHLYKV